jgi:hypothetical protein
VTCKLSAAKSLEGSAVTWHCAPHTRGPYKISISSCRDQFCPISIAPFGDAYEKIGTIQRRLAWPLHKDDTLFQSGRPTGLNIYFIFPSQISLLEDVAYFLCMFRTSLPQYLFINQHWPLRICISCGPNLRLSSTSANSDASKSVYG